jgi:hypothetical protein
MGSDKPGVAAIEAEVGALIHLFLLATAEAEDDFIFLSDDLGEIDGDVGSTDAPACGVARVVSDLSAMDHGLGGSAAHIDASATQIFSLDERDGPAKIGEAMSERIAGLAGADDDGVEFHGNPPESAGQNNTSDAVMMYKARKKAGEDVLSRARNPSRKRMTDDALEE